MKALTKNFQILFGLFWLIWMSLHVFILLEAGINFQSSVLDSVVTNLSLYLLAVIINNILIYYQPGTGKAWYIIVWCLLINFLWFSIINFTIPTILKHDTVFIEVFESVKLLRFILGFFLLLISALSMWMTQLSIFRNEENARRLELQKLAKDAELLGIRQQFQPHFLFNSLNSISALSFIDPEKSRSMIQQLSDFLRGTLRKDYNKLILITEELEHLKIYLDIEVLRFGHRLNTEIHIDEAAKNCMIPPLILLPIIENAIKYGLYESLGDVTIKIDIKKIDTNLIIEVSNPYDELSLSKNKGVGYGLSTLARRLFLIYGRNNLLKYHQDTDTFTTTLQIPQNNP